MTRYQMEATLVLHGWRCATGGPRYVGLCKDGRPSIVLSHKPFTMCRGFHGVLHNNEDIPLDTLTDAEFWKLAEAVMEEGL